jgi:hypothetical protein
MKRRDYNFELMSSAELWDLYNELTSRLAARLQGEVTLLQKRLDEIGRRVRAHPGRDRGTCKHAAVAKFRNPRAPFQTGQVEEHNLYGSGTCLTTAGQWTACGSTRPSRREIGKRILRNFGC